MRSRLVILLAVVVAGVLLAQSVAYACTTIIVGKARTADGSVLVAHTEDDPQFVLHLATYPSRPGGTYMASGGAQIAEPDQTIGYMGVSYVRRSGVPIGVPANSFAGINAYQVSTANNWTDPNESNETEMGITWTEFNELALMQAKTARQAVQIMGDLTETYGVDYDGTMYGIADAKEGWWINIAPGGQWVARRVPNNGAEMIANIYNITTVDFKDTKHKNFMWSPNVVGYAEAQGFYDPATDGPFNFREVYSSPATLTWEDHASSLMREEIVPQLLAQHKHIVVSDLMTILRNHYEGTKYDASGMPGFPHYVAEATPTTPSVPAGLYYPVDNVDTQTASVSQLRNWLPDPIGGVMWMTMREADSSVFVPWYSGVSSFPTPYTLPLGIRTDKTGSASWAFNDLVNWVNADQDAYYAERNAMVKAAFAPLEQRELAEQPLVDLMAAHLWSPKKPAPAIAYITEVSGGYGMEAYETAQSLLLQATPPATP